MDFKKWINYNISEINCPQCLGDGGYDYCLCGGSGFGSSARPSNTIGPNTNYDGVSENKHLRFIRLYIDGLCKLHTQLTNSQVDQLDGMYFYLSALKPNVDTEKLKDRIFKMKSNFSKDIILNRINKEAQNSENLSIFYDTESKQHLFGVTRRYGNYIWERPYSVHSKYLAIPTVRNRFAIFSTDVMDTILNQSKEISSLKGGLYNFYNNLGTMEDFILLSCKAKYLNFDFVDINNSDFSHKFLLRTNAFRALVDSKTELILNQTIPRNYLFNSKDLNEKKWL